MEPLHPEERWIGRLSRVWAYLIDGIQLAFRRLEVVWVLSTGRAIGPLNLGYAAGKALDSQIAPYLATCLGQI